MSNFSFPLGSSGRFEFSLGGLDYLEETIRKSLAAAGISDHGFGDPEHMQDMTVRRVDHSYRVGGEARLTLENFAGETHIEGGDEGEIRVRADGLVLDDAGMPANIRQDGDHLVIAQADLPGPKPVDYYLTVPRNCRVSVTGVEADVLLRNTGGTSEIETISGDVSITGGEGNYRVNAVNGEIALDGIAGTCVVSTMSSDITGTRLAGTLELRAVDGDVRIDRSALSRCIVSTMSGDVRVETTIDSSGEYTLNSANGDVRFSVPAGARVTATLSTHHGDIVAGRLEVIRREQHRLHGVLNGGGTTVTLEALHGDVALHEIDSASYQNTPNPVSPIEPIPAPAPVPAVEPIPAVEPMAEIPSVWDGDDYVEDKETARIHANQGNEPEREHTVDVLTRLGRGEMSVEEAMAHLGDI